MQAFVHRQNNKLRETLEGVLVRPLTLRLFLQFVQYGFKIFLLVLSLANICICLTLLAKEAGLFDCFCQSFHWTGRTPKRLR